MICGSPLNKKRRPIESKEGFILVPSPHGEGRNQQHIPYKNSEDKEAKPKFVTSKQ